MIHKYFSVSRSLIDEINYIVSESWVVYRHGIVVKLTSATVFTAAEDLAFERNVNPSYCCVTRVVSAL